MPKKHANVAVQKGGARMQGVRESLQILKGFCIEHKAQIGVFILAFAVFFLRRPDALLSPQFFAEDGRWFQDAYNHHDSLLTLLLPYAGYLVVFQRLVALLVYSLPLHAIPLAMNIAALAVQSLVLVYLWGKRTDFIDVKFKIFMTAVYILLPFTDEVHGNITNSQWYLAIILFLFLFMREVKNKPLRIVELVFAFVISITGPFAILLSPIIIYDIWRSKKMPAVYKVVLVGAVIQCISALLAFGDRKRGYIGISITHIVDIIGSQIFGAGLFGTKSVDTFLQKPWIAPLITILGIQLLAYVFIRSGKVLRYFLAFAAILFMATLVSPVDVPSGSSWLEVLNVEGVGGRYFFIPHLAIFIALGWLCFTRQKLHLLIRASAVALLVLSFAIGFPKDFIHTPYVNLQYSRYLQKYTTLSPGQKITIPTPPGSPWRVVLTK